MNDRRTLEMEKLAESEIHESRINIDNQVFSPKEDSEGFIKYRDSFQISKEFLSKLSSDYCNRSFCEEIDILEKIGGDDFIQRGLATNFSTGIKTQSKDEMVRRENEYGSNSKNNHISKWGTFVTALKSCIFQITFVCAVCALIIELFAPQYYSIPNSLIDLSVIIVLQIVTFLVQLRNTYKEEKEKSFRRYENLIRHTVIREGVRYDLTSNELLVGDLVRIYPGMKIPVDGYVIKSENLKADESSMTGESNLSEKETLFNCIKQRESIKQQGEQKNNRIVPSPILLSGTTIVEGEGEFIAIAVGCWSMEGRILQLLVEEPEEMSPLNSKISEITRKIGKFAILASLLIFAFLMVRLIFDQFSSDQPRDVLWNHLSDLLLIEISFLFAIIPQGFSLSLTLTLAHSVKKMLSDNVLIRKLDVCEKLAYVNIICTPANSVLTQNNISLISFWNNKTERNPADFINNLPVDLNNLMAQSLVSNNSAQLTPWETGSKTDLALLKFAQKCSINCEEIKKNSENYMQYPFNSRTKRTSTIIKLKDKLRLYVKGSSEIILNCCSNIHILEKNQIIPLDEDIKHEVLEVIEGLAQRAERTLILAYKDFNLLEDLNLNESAEDGIHTIERAGDLTFLALVGLRDPIRGEVPRAIETLQSAKIQIRVISGDNKTTCSTIARECSILKSNDKYAVLEGSDFINRIGGIVKINGKETIQNSEEFKEISERLVVLARARPDDKYALVIGLKQRGNVVAVVGDGTSDVPALKKADVGITLGISGTELARESAGIILLDDNFVSILKGIMWGRNIHQSIRKSLQFQLTVMLTVAFITIIGALSLRQNIFTPIQIIWIFLIVETLANVSLATGNPNFNILEKKPSRTEKSLISKKMLKHIVAQTLYQLIALMVIIFAGENFLPEYSDTLDVLIDSQEVSKSVKYNNDFVRSGRYDSVNSYRDIEYEFGPSRHFTIVFNTLFWMQIFNLLNCRMIRDEKNIFARIIDNWIYLIALLVIIVFQGLIITYGSSIFHVYKWPLINSGRAGLHCEQWLICIGFGLGSCLVSLLMKFVPEKKCFFFR